MAVVKHVIRYRIGLNSIIGRRYFPGYHRSTVEKFTAELCRTNWLTSYSIEHPQKYFVPGPMAVRRFGLPRRASDARGPQAYPVDFTTLLYCSDSKNKAFRLTSQEIAERFPWYESSTSPHAHCASRNGRQLTLEMLRLAHIGCPKQLARKYRQDTERHATAQECQQHFRLVILVGTLVRAKVLQAALGNLKWRTSVAIKFSVIPEMYDLFIRS